MTSDFEDALETLELAGEQLEELSRLYVSGLPYSDARWLEVFGTLRNHLEGARCEVTGLALIYDRGGKGERVPAANHPAA